MLGKILDRRAASQPDEPDPRASAREQVRESVAAGRKIRERMRTLVAEETALEAELSALADRHSAACEPLQRRLESSTDPRERAALRVEVSLENEKLESALKRTRQSLIAVRNEGRRAGEQYVLHAHPSALLRPGIADPDLLNRKIALERRAEANRRRTNDVRRRIAEFDTVISSYKRQSDSYDGNDLLRIGERKARAEAELAECFDEGGAIQRRIDALFDAMVNGE